MGSTFNSDEGNCLLYGVVFHCDHLFWGVVSMNMSWVYFPGYLRLDSDLVPFANYCFTLRVEISHYQTF